MARVYKNGVSHAKLSAAKLTALMGFANTSYQLIAGQEEDWKALYGALSEYATDDDRSSWDVHDLRTIVNAGHKIWSRVTYIPDEFCEFSEADHMPEKVCEKVNELVDNGLTVRLYVSGEGVLTDYFLLAGSGDEAFQLYAQFGFLEKQGIFVESVLFDQYTSVVISSQKIGGDSSSVAIKGLVALSAFLGWSLMLEKNMWQPESFAVLWMSIQFLASMFFGLSFLMSIPDLMRFKSAVKILKNRNPLLAVFATAR